MPAEDDIGSVAGENKSPIRLIGDEKCNREGDCGVDSDAKLNWEGGVSGSVLAPNRPIDEHENMLFDDEMDGNCDGMEAKPN